MDEYEQTDCSNKKRMLTEDEQSKLKSQNSRIVSEHVAKKLESDAKKHWDLFYKRNETRFFKDRHWTTREFCELSESSCDNFKRKFLFEVGCGVGNFIFPLISENLNVFIYACDFSPRAVEFVKSNPLYSSEMMTVFQADITTNDALSKIPAASVDIVTLIFVLSAISPEKHDNVLQLLFQVLKPGGMLLFRDYGLHDMAQLRFKPGHKISENFYMRQDGTRSYYFSEEYSMDMFNRNGFEIITNSYIERRTINKKDGIDVPRIFIQAKCIKPNKNIASE